MLDSREPRRVLGHWAIAGICGCLLAAGWIVYPHLSQGLSPASEIVDDSNLVEEEDSALNEENRSSAGDGKERLAPADDSHVRLAKPPLGQVTVLVPTKKFKKVGRNKVPWVSFDDIDIEKVLNTKVLSVALPEAMPEWLKNLNGQRIRIRGFMHPEVYQAEGIKRFVFCKDTESCCFGPDPTIYYLMLVTMRSGTSTTFKDRQPFDVEGVFRIEPRMHEKTGKVAEFYYIDDAQIVKQ